MQGSTGVLAPEPAIRRKRERVPDFCPPFEPPFDDGDGGGGGDGGRGDRPPPDEDPMESGVAEFGLSLALVGIVTIFLIFLLAWFLMRRATPNWPPALSAAPELLWLGTALLMSSSIALESAVDRRHTWVRNRARKALGLSVALGFGFLAAQTLLWTRLADAGFLPTTGGYGSIFYALTGLHAAHVFAGLLAIGWLFVSSFRAAGLTTRRLRLGAMYWHSMGGIWIVLFAVLYLGH